jgi:hypothetical protein
MRLFIGIWGTAAAVVASVAVFSPGFAPTARESVTIQPVAMRDVPASAPWTGLKQEARPVVTLREKDAKPVAIAAAIATPKKRPAIEGASEPGASKPALAETGSAQIERTPAESRLKAAKPAPRRLAIAERKPDRAAPRRLAAKAEVAPRRTPRLKRPARSETRIHRGLPRLARIDGGRSAARKLIALQSGNGEGTAAGRSSERDDD